MKIRIDNAILYCAEDKKFHRDTLLVEEDKIAYIGPDFPSADTVLNADGLYVVPGFVDIHTHGCAGGDFVSAKGNLLHAMARAYAYAGTTTVMPTLASDSFENLLTACDDINGVTPRMGCHFGGIHLEGRYLNPVKRGAHALEYLAQPNCDELKVLLGHMGKNPHITAAFEMDENGSFIQEALKGGATLALGHTAATYKQAMTCIERGVTTFTHLFNAMPSLHHRDGGPVCAALNSDVFIELICDGFHIVPEMVRLAYHAHNPDKFVLITDSLSATGMPDGEYTIAGSTVHVKDGKALTPDGTIGGSTLTIKKAVENLISFVSIPLEQALYHGTLAPARAVGLDHSIGSLKAGKMADLLMIRPAESGQTFDITKVMVGGDWVAE